MMNIDAESKLKIKVQRWIVLCSIVLMAGKFAAFWLTDSVGVLTDAMESIVNVAAGFISLYSLRMAAKPRDKQHPFGHGKVELLSASVEGLMILIAGGIIIFEGIRRIMSPTMPEKLDIGIVIVAAAGIVNYILGWYSMHIGKRHNSMALVAGGRHLQSDTYSTIGLVVGLILLYVTRIPWIDSALALIFGGIIAWTGVSILRKTADNLLDKADMQMLKNVVEAIDKARQDDWVDIHNLKMIKYGSAAFIDCDLTLPWYYNIEEGHAASEKLRFAIDKGVSQYAMVSIHTDSCEEKHCEHCLVQACPYRKEAFVSVLKFNIGELTQIDEEREEAHAGH